MKNPPLSMLIFRRLAGQMPSTRWLVVAAVLAAIYLAVLATATGSSQAAAPAVAPRLASEQSTGDPVPTAEAAGVLGERFQAEYDRLAAGNQEEDAGVERPANRDLSSILGTTLFSLAAVSALAYGGLWALRRSGVRLLANPGQSLGVTGNADLLAVRETRQLSPNQKLHLVQMGEEVLLLGATDQTITCLARYPAGQIPATFSDHLQAVTRETPFSPDGWSRAAPAPPGPMPTAQDSLAQLRRLQGGRQGGRDHA
jgi:flagellar biogenesis protein FliO